MASDAESDLIDYIIRLRADLQHSEDQIAECVDDLQNVLVAESHRVVVEQAKGMLMGRSPDLTADEAFGLLVVASQRENIFVRDIAERLVDRQDAAEE